MEDSMEYSGTIPYGDGDRDVLEFESFIYRHYEIGFTAKTTWDKKDEWDIGATTELIGKRFETGDVKSTQVMNSGRSVTCQVIFSEVEPQGSGIKVTGFWLEDNIEYPFSGTLERKD